VAGVLLNRAVAATGETDVNRQSKMPYTTGCNRTRAEIRENVIELQNVPGQPSRGSIAIAGSFWATYKPLSGGWSKRYLNLAYASYHEHRPDLEPKSFSIGTRKSSLGGVIIISP
jgi:hypothetical protein